jgi:DNA-binding CsgD family transcriptional regulator
VTAVMDRRAAAALDLSPLESTVLEHVSYGLTNEQLARRLGVTYRTVRDVLADLFSKLHVPNRVALVGTGFRLGLLRPRPLRPGVPRLVLRPLLAPLPALIAEGLTDEQIAARLSTPGQVVTAAAVRARVAKLRVRLGAVSREHAVRLAVEAKALRLAPSGAREAS